VGVGFGENAAASPRPETFINECPGSSPGRRIRRREVNHAAAVMEFVSLAGIVPSQSEVERQFRCDLPFVLTVEAPGFLAPLDLVGGGNSGGVRKSQQETGVAITDTTTADCCGL